MLCIVRSERDLWVATGPDYRFYVRALSMSQALRKASSLLAKFQRIEST